MKVLYSIGPDTGTDNIALRYSLRSLEKHASNLDEVIVVGYPPSWLTDKVKTLTVEGDKRKYKHHNIMSAILAAIDAGMVDGEFLYSSDDHFLIKDIDLNRYPYYYKGELPSFDEVIAAEGVFKWGGYMRSLTDTQSLLKINGLDTHKWCGHCNTHMDARVADEVKRLIAQKPLAKNGYEPTCVFMSLMRRKFPERIAGTFREDCKLSDYVDEQTFWNQVGDRDTFSIAGGLLSRNLELRTLLATVLYPEKSRFES